MQRPLPSSCLTHRNTWGAAHESEAPSAQVLGPDVAKPNKPHLVLLSLTREPRRQRSFWRFFILSRASKIDCLELLENNHTDQKAESNGITRLGLIYCIFNFCCYCRARGQQARRISDAELHAALHGYTRSSTKRAPSPPSATPGVSSPGRARWVPRRVPGAAAEPDLGSRS